MKRSLPTAMFSQRQVLALLGCLALLGVLAARRSQITLSKTGSAQGAKVTTPVTHPRRDPLPPARNASWIPVMQPGLVAKKHPKFPYDQCWTPLCATCELLSTDHGDELKGLNIYVLTAGGDKERVMRDVIRSTWGKEVVLLGAKVFFVFGNTIRQWGEREAKLILQESKERRDVLLVDIRGSDGWAVEDSYMHLAYKVMASLKSGIAIMEPHRSWFMKVDSDTYVNAKRLGAYIAGFKSAAEEGNGAWQYAGFHNNGGVTVRGASATGKEAMWAEPEYAAIRSKYPPFAFGAAGWILGYDAIAHLVARAEDPAVIRPKGIEDALIGVLLEDCDQCDVVRWDPCEIMGGTSFPFAPQEPQGTCPSFRQRVGMAVADKELSQFRCLVTLSEIKAPTVFQDIHHIVTHGEL